FPALPLVRLPRGRLHGLPVPRRRADVADLRSGADAVLLHPLLGGGRRARRLGARVPLPEGSVEPVRVAGVRARDLRRGHRRGGGARPGRAHARGRGRLARPRQLRAPARLRVRGPAGIVHEAWRRSRRHRRLLAGMLPEPAYSLVLLVVAAMSAIIGLVFVLLIAQRVLTSLVSGYARRRERVLTPWLLRALDSPAAIPPLRRVL